MATFDIVILYAIALALPSVACPLLCGLLYWLKAPCPGHDTSTDSRSSRPLAKEYYKEGRFPGPWQFPIIGRVHGIPRFSLWLKFTEWADKFGPIYQVSMAGQDFIVVSDEGMATDLLIKNGNSFGGRPQIRALIDHKLGPVYSALMDRHGEPSLSSSEECC